MQNDDVESVGTTITPDTSPTPTPTPAPTPPTPPMFPQYSAPAPPIAPAPITPVKKRHRKALWITLTAVPLLAGAAVMVYFFAFQMPTVLPEFSQAMLDELEQQYGYDITYEPDVALNKEYSIPIQYALSDCMNEKKCTEDFAVYTDAALTIRADATVVAQENYTDSSDTNETVRIMPPSELLVNDRSQVESDGSYKSSSEKSTIKIGAEKSWGASNIYYVAQRVDETGKTLERPKVTVFTVETPKAPTVMINVSDDGGVTFSWDAIENASDYYLVMITQEKSSFSIGNNTSVTYNVLAKTSKTSLNLADYSGDIAQAQVIANNTEDGTTLSTSDADFWKQLEKTMKLSQNQQLHAVGLQSEDDLYGAANQRPEGTYEPTENGMPLVSFAVVAARGNSRSSMHTVDGASLLAQIPDGMAINARTYMYGEESTYYQECYETHARKSDDCLYELMPVTMLDGRTVLKPVIYDTTSVKTNGKSGDDKRVVYTYHIQGTLITHLESTLDDDIAAVTKNLERINKRNLEAYGRFGSKDLTVVYAEMGAKLPEKQASTTDEATNEDTTTETASVTSDLDSVVLAGTTIPINGSTPLVKYIAKNILLGKSSFYTDSYQKQDPTVQLNDALHEAIYQNPYTQLVTGNGYRYYLYSNGIAIENGANGGLSSAEIAAVHQKVQQVATSITTPTMSERDKALAINKWLVDNATYDDGAFACMSSDVDNCEESFPYAWVLLGTLSKGTGVCDSYADTFKALADAAGLQSVWVSGVVTSNGGLHAWNKVFMDGKWQIVDTTWDDGSFEDGGSATQYFGLSDTAAGRIQDNDFVVDRLVATYAANP